MSRYEILSAVFTYSKTVKRFNCFLSLILGLRSCVALRLAHAFENCHLLCLFLGRIDTKSLNLEEPILLLRARIVASCF